MKTYGSPNTRCVQCLGLLSLHPNFSPEKATGSGPSSVEKQEFTWVNTIPGNAKNAIQGTYHVIHGKHLGRYLGAFACRFNRRLALDRMVEWFTYVACRTALLLRKFAVMAEVHTQSG